ncbi:insecticidal delta-endotoxin Cry8Ea1 family protein [Bacillus thuringiensis]|nr:insecticidal delta-endotoxin Cry8Ea1 family protein [Bacillus thuringiensis]
MAGTSLIPDGGIIISPLITLLWPSDSTQENATKQLLDQVSKMIDGKIIDYDKESLSTDLNNAKNDLKSLENGLQSGSQGITPPGASHAPEESDTYHRELANNANQSLRKLIENCRKSSFQTSELPIYTIAATAHLELLSFLVENGKKSTFNYSDEHMRDLKNDLAQAITDYRNHISDTNWSVFSKYHNDVDINNRLNEQSYTASTRDNPAFHVAYIAAKNTYVRNGGDIDKIRKVDDNYYIDITPDINGRLSVKSHAPNASLKFNVYTNGVSLPFMGRTLAPNETTDTGSSFSPDTLITITIEIDGREIVVLDGYKFKDIPKTPPFRSGEESIKNQWL